MLADSIVSCGAQAIGIILPISGAISLLYNENTSTAKTRAFSMATAQFVSCLVKSYADESSPESSHSNAAIVGSIKYSFIDFLMGQPISTTRVVLGAYNSAAYSYEEDLSNYFKVNADININGALPVLIESFEAVLGPAIKRLFSHSAIKIEGSDVAKSGLIGAVVVIAVDITYPASKTALSYVGEALGHLVELSTSGEEASFSPTELKYV